MPAACAADLREELLARVWGPTTRAASRQDAQLAEMDALEAAGDLTPPDDWELCELVRDPGAARRTARMRGWLICLRSCCSNT